MAACSPASLATILPLSARQSASLPDVELLPCDFSPQEARIVALEAELLALHGHIRRAHLILDSVTDYVIVTMDGTGRITSWNSGAEIIMGYAAAEVLGQPGDLVFTAENRADGSCAAELQRATENGRASYERWHLRRDGTRFWAVGVTMPLRDESRQHRGFVTILRDRTDVQVEAERRDLLLAEMDHRLRNSITLMQAMAVQAYRHTNTLAEFQEKLGKQLMELAHSNAKLTNTDRHDAKLRDVITGALHIYSGGEPRCITVVGPAVSLSAELAVTVGLCLHELVTNAVKHGALSIPAGRVDVSWDVSGKQKGVPKVTILWRERGGPAVKPPRRLGFGSQLLKRGMPPGGMVKLEFPSEELECRLCLPLNDWSSTEIRHERSAVHDR